MSKTKILGELESATGSGVLADAKQIKNGYIVVETLDERNALKAGVLSLGMPVYVSDLKQTYRKTSLGWERCSVEMKLDTLQTKVDGLREVSVEYNEETENLQIEGTSGAGAGGVGSSYLPFAISLTGTFASRNISEMFDYTNKAFSVDWGDGTVNTETTHTYATEAEYTIKVYGEFDSLWYVKDADAYADNAPSTLTAVEVGEGVKAFGEKFFFYGSFYACKGLTSVVIHDGIKTIPYSTFYACIALKDIIIPERVKEIGNLAFCDSGLENITIPKSVVTIGRKAFQGCISLKSVTLKNETPPALGEEAFKGTTVAGVSPNLSVVLTVPAGHGSQYKNAEGWREYADLIKDVLGDLKLYKVNITFKINERNLIFARFITLRSRNPNYSISDKKEIFNDIRNGKLNFMSGFFKYTTNTGDDSYGILYDACYNLDDDYLYFYYDKGYVVSDGTYPPSSPVYETSINDINWIGVDV
jgi:hypothetical protein